MNLLLRAFGIRDEKPEQRTVRCPHCGHERQLGPLRQSASDAYLSGASLEWVEFLAEEEAVLNDRSPRR